VYRFAILCLYVQGQRNVKTLIARVINIRGGRSNGAEIIKLQRSSFPIRNFDRSDIGLISNAFLHEQIDSLLVLKALCILKFYVDFSVELSATLLQSEFGNNLLMLLSTISSCPRNRNVFLVLSKHLQRHSQHYPHAMCLLQSNIDPLPLTARTQIKESELTLIRAGAESVPPDCTTFCCASRFIWWEHPNYVL
jgi:hypothetical protein